MIDCAQANTGRRHPVFERHEFGKIKLEIGKESDPESIHRIYKDRHQGEFFGAAQQLFER